MLHRCSADALLMLYLSGLSSMTVLTVFVSGWTMIHIHNHMTRCSGEQVAVEPLSVAVRHEDLYVSRLLKSQDFLHRPTHGYVLHTGDQRPMEAPRVQRIWHSRRPPLLRYCSRSRDRQRPRGNKRQRLWYTRFLWSSSTSTASHGCSTLVSRPSEGGKSSGSLENIRVYPGKHPDFRKLGWRQSAHLRFTAQ